MSIRSYLSLLLLGCAIIGVGLLALTRSSNQAAETAQKESSEVQLAQAELQRFEDLFKQWLVLGDLIFGSQETYLIYGAKEIGKKLETQLDKIATQSTKIGDSKRFVAPILTFTRGQLERLETTLSLSGEQLESESNRFLGEMDDASYDAIDALEGLKTSWLAAVQQKQLLATRAEEARESMRLRVTLVFIASIGLLWLGTSLLIGNPLKRLAREAHDALEENRPLSLSPQGTKETRELNLAFTSLVADLERRVSARTEQFEKAAIEAKAADKAKSEFLAAMSHEIRTPMNGIVGMNELLLQANLPPRCVGYAQTIHRSAEAMLELINQILDFSKVEANKLELDPMPFDLRDTIEDVAELYSVSAQEAGLHLYCSVAPGVHNKLLGDAPRLRQVLTNLVSNSIKFTEEGCVTLACETVSESDDTLRFRIKVSDTGIGIPKEAQAKLFDSFTQADASTTRKYGGTGLGLAICRSIVETMGSSIDLQSSPGEGSCFSFELELPKTNEVSEAAQSIGDATGIEGLEVKLAIEDPVLETEARIWVQRWGCKLSDSSNAFAIQDTTTPCPDAAHIVRLHPITRLPEQGDGDTNRSLSYAALPLRPRDLLKALSCCDYDRYDSSPTPLQSGALTTETPVYSPPGESDILVVDDNVTNREIAIALFANEGLHPHTAESGERALQLCSKNEYKLIFMDCMMPGIDGFETTRRLRGDDQNPNHATAIVALTANAMPGDREACLESGMDDYLAKPLRPAGLAAIIEKWYAPSANDPTPEEAPECFDLDALTAAAEQDAAETVLTAPAAPSPHTADEEIFSVERLKEILGDDPATIDMLLGVFLESLEESLAELEIATNEIEDLEKMRLYSHSIKGSAANYGVEKLRSIAEKMEHACRDGDKPTAVSLYREVTAAADQSKAAVLAYRAS